MSTFIVFLCRTNTAKCDSLHKKSAPLTINFLYDAIEPGNVWLVAKFELPIAIRFRDSRGLKKWCLDPRSRYVSEAYKKRDF